MVSYDLIILIVVIVTLLVFVVAIFIGSAIADTSATVTFTPQTGTFLTPCTTVSCQNGLVCDGTDFTCKFGEGTSCTSFSQCVTGLICSGLCATGPTGGLNQLCPCNPGNICQSNENSLSVCKLDIGQNCTTSEDCITGICINGTCSTGTTGSFTEGLFYVCSNTEGCTGPLVCYNNRGNACGPTDNTCSCLFNYNNPNQSFNTECIKGMNFDSGTETCRNDPGLGCSINSDCANNTTCSGGPVVAGYLFDNVIKTNYLGAIQTEIQTLFPGPTGSINPVKLFASSSGSIDTIYFLDSNLGLFTTVYDTSIKNFQGWSQLLNNVVTLSNGTGTILDACIINNTTLLIAFLQQSIYYTLYTYNISTMNFSVFNFQSGSGISGSQYRITDNSPLIINYIDYSTTNDVIIVSQGTVYVKQQNQSKYSVFVVSGNTGSQYLGQSLTGTYGPSYFYEGTGTSSQNISFIKNYTLSNGSIIRNILQYSGQLSAAALPIDRFRNVEYEVFNYSFKISVNNPNPQYNVILLVSTYKNSTEFIDYMVAISYLGSTTIVPYNIGLNSITLATNNGFYIFTSRSC